MHLPFSEGRAPGATPARHAVAGSRSPVSVTLGKKRRIKNRYRDGQYLADLWDARATNRMLEAQWISVTYAPVRSADMKRTERWLLPGSVSKR